MHAIKDLELTKFFNINLQMTLDLSGIKSR
jgi:hypothetical protein